VAAPTSPAFDAIGATPTTIAHPTSIQAMGASLLSYVDQSGHINAGLALEAAPIWLLIGDRVTLKEWRENLVDRALSRLTVSFATAAGVSGVTNVAEGLRFVLWDDSDPRWDTTLEKCLVNAVSSGLPKRAGGALPADTDTTPGQSPVVVDAAVKSCQDQAKARGNNGASAGALSGAVTEQQDTSGNATFGKVYGWFSASKNFGSGARWLSLLGSIRYVYDNPGDEIDVGARIRAGNNDLGVSIDGAWTPVIDASNAFHGQAGIVGINGEIQISAGLWLAATAGGKFGPDSGGPSNLFSVLNCKFATESSASITPTGQ
jgi:hypothetical protein